MMTIIWLMVCNITLITVRCDVTEFNKDTPLGLIRECLGVRGESLRICNNVTVEEEITTPNANCNIEECKKSCCSSASKCHKSNVLSKALFNCISDKVVREHGSCCILVDKQYKYVRTIYLSGAFGVLLTCAGVYVLSSMKSENDTVNIEEPIYDYGEDGDIKFERDAPHLKVEKLIATDGDDVFWEN